MANALTVARHNLIARLVFGPAMPVEPAHYEIQALCPDTGKLVTLRIMDDDVRRVLATEPRFRFFELMGDRKTFTGSCVQEVLRDPLSIWDGLRDRRFGGRCYVGVPSCRWFDNESSAPPPPGMVFAVFVNPRGCVFEWGWEKADEANPELPKGYDKRFGGRIWPQA